VLLSALAAEGKLYFHLFSFISRRTKLVYVGFDVFHVLKADGEADVVLGDAGGGLLFGVSCWWVVEAG